jgi:hypothetical protein
MFWEDLQAEAKRIIETVPEGDFEDVSFRCGSGGAPANKVGVPEIHRDEIFAYATNANGNAYQGEVVVRCRHTGCCDGRGLPIYEAENGVVFVFDYYAGSPSSFDSGSLVPPSLR